MPIEDDSDLSLDSLFTEPPRPPTPQPTVALYTRGPRQQNSGGDDGSDSNTGATDWADIQIRLVGTHPLWGHHLWNAARSFASYLDSNTHLYYNRNVLELGAGGGLPGLVAARNGASQVVLTDYPDANLITNLEYNVVKNIPVSSRRHVSVQGYIWGRPAKPLLDLLPASPKSSGGFDLIIMSDLIFNHSQHDALLRTCELALTPGPQQGNTQPTSVHFSSSRLSAPQERQPNLDYIPSLLVFYTHHRPHLAYRDIEFFARARRTGWKCEEVVTEKFPLMFPEDSGDEQIRSTVHGWRLTREIGSVEA